MIIRKAKHENQDINPENNKEKIKWLFQYSCLISLWYFLTLISIFVFDKSITEYYLQPLLTNICYFIVLNKIVNQKFYFNEPKTNENEALNLNGQTISIRLPVKYSKTALNNVLIDEYSNRLKSYLEEKKPYLQNELTIKDVSEALNVPVYQLSQVINQKFEKNFFDLINYYRIEEARQLIKSPGTSKIKIESIAFHCGFGSKTSFYNAFKKNTGLTPSDYKNSISR
jgi:AraC-like DNA-binding protein